jgi:hypothetical protein
MCTQVRHGIEDDIPKVGRREDEGNGRFGGELAR